MVVILFPEGLGQTLGFHFSFCPFVTRLGGQTPSSLLLMRMLTVETQL